MVIIIKEKKGGSGECQIRMCSFMCCGLLKERDASIPPGEEEKRKTMEKDEAMEYGRRQGIQILIDQVIDFSLVLGKD